MSLSTPIKKYSWFWMILLGLSIGLLWLTRYQTLTFIPIILLIIWIKPEVGKNEIKIKPSAEKIQNILIVCISMILTFLPWALSGLIHGLTLKQMLGLQIYGNSAIPIGKNISDLLFWNGISMAFFILLAAPVLAVLLQGVTKVGEMVKDLKILIWLIFFGGIAISLFVTLTNHAWRAGYNYPEPTRLLGRYAIYLSVLTWLTAIILYWRLVKINLIKLILVSVSGLFLIGISYLAIHDPNWIFPKNPLFFFYIDGYLPAVNSFWLFHFPYIFNHFSVVLSG